MPLEQRTARLTILVDPRKKEMFERLCAEQDLTPSQVLRQLMRDFIETQTGEPWQPVPAGTRAAGRKASARRRAVR
ncbi:MAG TPA: hypothetical protein VMI92_05210 [Steroidobacteraceae bacterium]|nr:hypothetical protein [Steroidobacteraceae bacterium]